MASDSLIVVPSFVRSDSDLSTTVTTLRTLREQEPDVDVLVVDDASPMQDQLLRALEIERLGVDVSLKQVNEGFSATVNVGLRRALATGQHAILCNADMEFNNPFVRTMEISPDDEDRPAAVVGGLLLYDSGLIQHAGVYLSFLTRAFDHRFRFGPAALPEAHQPKICPVTGALQFIRDSTLEEVGLYDEDFRMGFEDVDYCLRVFDAGLKCVYDPRVVAIHHESMFRGQADPEGKLSRWQLESLATLHSKHGKTSLGAFVPPIA